MKVLSNEANSVLSKKRDITIDINIKQTQDELKHLRLFDVLDQNKQYEKEKVHCKRYRPIITIKPYCTNVLFNPLTEVVYKEGSEDCVVFTDNNSDIPQEIQSKILGKKNSINRQYLIENTEYSHPSIGFNYHIGYDFLNNHILRNKTVKSIFPPKMKGQDSERFNTISDVMRLIDGRVHRFRNRFSSSETAEGGRVVTQGDSERHLYEINDLIRYSDEDFDSLLIKKQNGWFGLDNNSSVKTNSELTETEYHRPLNCYETCSFVDFYPKRTLFSFNPKFNDYKDRYEHNWDYIFSYPYQELYEHEIISNDDINAIRVTSVKIEKISKGYYVTKVYTELNNNLKNGNTIDFILETNSGNTILGEDIHITKSLKDNSFYIDNIDILQTFIPNGVDTYDLTENTLENINNNLSLVSFRLRRKYNGNPVKYYIKTVKRLANDEFRKRDYTTGEDVSLFFEEQCSDKNGNLSDFNRRVYDLGFSQTLFGDNITQIYYSDELNLEYLTNKKGNPITDIYFTIIKTNRGNEEWYKGDFNNEKVEYSHAFGNISSCLHTNTPIDEIKKLKSNYDYRLVNNLGLYKSKHLESNITQLGGIGKNEFIHCICEYSPEEQQEVVLSNVHYRFNTKQRELGEDRGRYNLFKKCIFKDIKKDDFDFGGFELEEFELTGKTVSKDGKEISYFDRPEGYYYKPFYNIKIAEKSKYPKTIYNPIMVVKELSIEGDRVKLKTQHIHRLRTGMIIEVHNYDNHKEWVRLMVDEVYDLNFFSCKVLDNSKLNLIDKNNLFTVLSPKIPYYADKVKYNTYVYSDYVYYDNNIIHYKNLRNYINLNINFFLRRQDSEGDGKGLYVEADILPRENQIYDTIKQEIDLEDYGC